jgi:hypothetical protein
VAQGGRRRPWGGVYRFANQVQMDQKAYFGGQIEKKVWNTGALLCIL